MQKHCWLHVWKQYYNKIIDLNRHFSVLKKYMNNFDCLEHIMLLIRKLTLSMSTSETQFKQNYFWNIAYLIIKKYTIMLIIFWQFILWIELENGVTMSLKYHSFISLIFTCFQKFIKKIIPAEITMATPSPRS